MKKKPSAQTDQDTVQDFETHPENWETDQELMAEITTYREKKDQRVNIRVSRQLMERLKSNARKKGLPYQTYIYSKLFRVAFGEPDLKEQLLELKARIKKLEDTGS